MGDDFDAGFEGFEFGGEFGGEFWLEVYVDDGGLGEVSFKYVLLVYGDEVGEVVELDVLRG